MDRSACQYVFGIALSQLALVSFALTAGAQPSGAWHIYAWQLWRIDVDGTNLRPLDTTPTDRCGSPDWSPDGKFVTYDVLSEPSDGYQIAVIRADGTDRRLIGRGSIPTWSPDGKLIACQGSGLQIMNADGSGRETLPGNAHSLRWSPRGDVIFAGIGHQLLVFDLATGKQRVHCASTNRISHGYGISPDGLRICYGTPDDGLWVATLDEKMKSVTNRQVVPQGTAYHASWAPDGKRVVFAWQPDFKTLTQIYTLDVDGNGVPKLVPGIDTKVQNVNPDWSPDGKTIVFSRPGRVFEF